jgi:hypothetical protein
MDPWLKRCLWFAGLAAGAGAAVVLFLFDPSVVPIYPRCIFHNLTGLDCPGCGTLRALHQLLHGHLLVALQFNAIAVLSLPLFAGLGLRLAWTEIKGGPTMIWRPLWLWLYLSVWVAFGVLRNLPVPLLAWFAP